MQYKLIRSSRRTVALVINRQGDLIVRAPRFALESEIERFIKLKRLWIEKHQINVKKRAGRKKFYVDGERFYFLGREFSLRVLNQPWEKLFFQNGEFILPSVHRPNAQRLFEDWYRGQAKVLLTQRAIYFAQKMEVSFKKISITGAGTRWGSCSARGSINFSWRLVMAPLEVIDYVVVHELAHLAHHNHSRKFWRLTQSFAPNYKQARKWLNNNGHSLTL